MIVFPLLLPLLTSYHLFHARFLPISDSQPHHFPSSPLPPPCGSFGHPYRYNSMRVVGLVQGFVQASINIINREHQQSSIPSCLSGPNINWLTSEHQIQVVEKWSSCSLLLVSLSFCLLLLHLLLSVLTLLPTIFVLQSCRACHWISLDWPWLVWSVIYQHRAASTVSAWGIRWSCRPHHRWSSRSSQEDQIELISGVLIHQDRSP